MLNIVLIYLGLVISVVELINYIPFRKAQLPKVLQLGGFSLFFLLQITGGVSFSLPQNVAFLAVILVFTVVSRILRNMFLRNIYVGFLKPGKLLEILHFLDWDKVSLGRLKLKSLLQSFQAGDHARAEGIFRHLLAERDLPQVSRWNSEVLSLLIFLNKSTWALEYVQTIKPDLTRKKQSPQFIIELVQVYTRAEQWDKAREALKYLEENYSSPAHFLLLLTTYLYLYTYAGKTDEFEELTRKYPMLQQLPALDYYRGMVYLKAGDREKTFECLERFEKSLTPETDHLKSVMWDMKTAPEKFILKDPGKAEDFSCPIPDLKLPPPSGEGEKVYPWAVFLLMGVIGIITLVQFFLAWNGTLSHFTRNPGGISMDFIKAGALTGQMVAGGQWIRIITCVFLHSGWMHLLFNLYALFNLGQLCNRIYGTFRFLFIFLFAGVIGSLAMLFFGSSDAISIGASGGIFGVLGASFVFILSRRKIMPKEQYNRVVLNFSIIILINIFLGIQLKNISNLAHMAGLISGLSAGAFFLFVDKKLPNLRKGTSLFSLVLVASGMILAVVLWPGVYTGKTGKAAPFISSVSRKGVELPLPFGWEVTETETSFSGEDGEKVKATLIVDSIMGQKIVVLPVEDTEKVKQSFSDFYFLGEDEREILHYRYQNPEPEPGFYDVNNYYILHLKKTDLLVVSLLMERYEDEYYNKQMDAFLKELILRN